MPAPTVPPAPVGPFSPAQLPGKGLAQHPFFYAGEWNHPKPEQEMFIVRDGKVVYDLNGLTRPEWTTLPKGYLRQGDAAWDAITPALRRRQ